MPTDEEWDGPTEVTLPTWINEAENARQERTTLASIEREQLRELARPPTNPPPGTERSRR